MKKNIEKILASASMAIALVLIIILVVAAFGGITQEDFDNSLVRGLIITMGVLYALLAGGALTMLFLGSDAVKEITLRSEQGGTCKATLGVIRNLVKESFSGIQGVKVGKVALIVNEYGVKLKVSVKITDRDVFETETYLRTLLEEVFKGALGFRFHAIEFKIVALQARFKPDMNKVQETVDEKVAEHTPNFAVVPNMVEQVGGPVADEAAAEAEVADAEAQSLPEEAPAAEEEAEVSEEPAAEDEADAEGYDTIPDGEEKEEETVTEEEAPAEDGELDKE